MEYFYRTETTVMSDTMTRMIENLDYFSLNIELKGGIKSTSYIHNKTSSMQ